jgi:hypothetical protein
MLTKKQHRFMQIEELQRLLKAHDFYYVYSDDGRVYDKGKTSQEKIDVLIKEIGIKGKNMYKQYMLMQ